MMTNIFGRCEAQEKDYDRTKIISEIEDGNLRETLAVEREEICGGQAKENWLGIEPKNLWLSLKRK
ncbi:hypothetical protein BH20ACI4_BH20ACI4_04090 [soil metagenome]